MTELQSIFKNLHTLRSSTKVLSIDELKSFREKLDRVIDDRIKAEEKALEKQKEKAAKVEELVQQMADMGLSVDDLNVVAQPAKKKGSKRAVKYKIKNADGETVAWTGVGRMPRIYQEALESGSKLTDFAV